MTNDPDRPRPPHLDDAPRYAGVASFMRLPLRADAQGLDVALAGVPWDGGTTNRPGARHGPREIRNMSSLIRRVNPANGIAPFDLCRVADVGDAPVNPLSIPKTLERVEGFVGRILEAGAAPLIAGGDHLVTLPILRALARSGPVGLVHIDAHCDTWDSYFDGERYTHGTPFRRAVEEGLIDPARVVQVGIRGSLYDFQDMAFPRQAGFTVIPMTGFEAAGLAGVLARTREVVGEAPVYVSFDIDALDPAFAPGTGTPEAGGLTTREALALVRGLRGLDLVGAYVVEVAPPFDPSGNTALVAATLMFELLCVLAEAVSRRRGEGER